jgi:hypothetical protein
LSLLSNVVLREFLIDRAGLTLVAAMLLFRIARIESKFCKGSPSLCITSHMPDKTRGANQVESACKSTVWVVASALPFRTIQRESCSHCAPICRYRLVAYFARARGMSNCDSGGRGGGGVCFREAQTHSRESLAGWIQPESQGGIFLMVNGFFLFFETPLCHA